MRNTCLPREPAPQTSNAGPNESAFSKESAEVPPPVAIERSLSRTTTALLDGLHDSEDHETWSIFDHRYRPIILRFLGHHGFSAGDSADITQEVMLEIVRAYRAGHYDRERGPGCFVGERLEAREDRRVRVPGHRLVAILGHPQVFCDLPRDCLPPPREPVSSKSYRAKTGPSTRSLSHAGYTHYGTDQARHISRMTGAVTGEAHGYMREPTHEPTRIVRFIRNR